MVGDHTYIWDIHRLVELSSSLPHHQVSLQEISELDEVYWFDSTSSVPTCRAVADHAKLIEETDLSHPIILSKNGRVMDGMHRVAKAYLRGDSHILAVQFEEDPDPDYIDVDLDSLPYDNSV